jgi:hypothetical protein
MLDAGPSIDAGQSIDAGASIDAHAIDATAIDSGPSMMMGELNVLVSGPTPIESLSAITIPAGTVLNVIVTGESIAVSASASGGTEPYTYTWRSDRDGNVGSGASASLALSEGDHEITVDVGDALGARGSASLTMHVLPSTFDWSHMRRPSAPPAAGDWMTPVRHQQTCGSCWAFAALAVVEAQLNIQSGSPDLDVDLSEQTVIDCDTHSLGCIAGASEQSLSGYLHDVGAPIESCNPFLGDDDMCLAGCRDGATPPRYRVESTTMVVPEVGSPRDAVQAWMRYQLVHHGPIARTIQDIYGYDPSTHRCSPTGGSHYVAVVGYDHAARLWIAKNSWGPGWNGNGYFDVEYGYCAIDASATIVDRVIAP